MAKIINNTKRDISMLSLHVIPKSGSLEGISNSLIRSSDNWPMLNGLALAGEITIEFDQEKDVGSGEIFTEQVSALPRPDDAALAEARLAEVAAAEDSSLKGPSIETVKPNGGKTK